MRQRAKDLIEWGRGLFPVRVWLHFLDQNGLILAAGMSYQALFAVFAAVYVGFSMAGIWLVNRTETLRSLIDIVNTTIPGLIGDDGILTVDQILAAGSLGTGFLTWTGVIALGGLVWTAIGWITFSRMAVRAVFGLPKDKRNYFLMKARDFLMALLFGALLLVAAALSVASTEALDWVFRLFGVSTASPGYALLARGSGFLIVLVINTLVLAALFRFLSRSAIPWRRVWGGSLLGGTALLVLQLGSSLLIGGATRNPLLATFAVFIGLLLFFRLTSIVTLAAAAWIAVGALDREEPLVRVSKQELERQRLEREHAALVGAAQVRVRDARKDYESARWYQRFAAAGRLRAAESELAELAEETPGWPPARS